MSYEKWTIKNLVEKIGSNEVYLPAIQRKFVWKQEQTERLFDSIQRGYPIGTFLFWYLKRPNIDSYVFYRFLKDYHQRDNYLNTRIPNPELKDEIIGILDGQQRLSSIYLALQGTYAVKPRHARATSEFPRLKLFLNLLGDLSGTDESENNYQFKFISENDSKIANKNSLWFDVREVLAWDKYSPPIDDFYDSLVEANAHISELYSLLNESITRSKIKRTIRDLHSRLVRDEIINYFKIEDQDLDKILKIFVRVNSGGTVLSKTDLLFSTIVANWEDGRDEIEQLLSRINKIGDKFGFNNDFIMRNCLMLTDCDVLFRVGSFKTENVVKIKENWGKIKSAIFDTINLLASFGLSSATLPSHNAVLPISYYIFKNGIVNSDTKAQLRKYILNAFLKNIFGSQSDSVLTSLRTALREKDPAGDGFQLRETRFNFENIAESRLPSNKSLKVSENDIDDFLKYKKGVNSFFILSLLYPNLKFDQVAFHQDHIHPVSQFSKAKMHSLNIQPDQQRKMLELKDTIPNLQFMEGKENKQKTNIAFEDWVNGRPDREKFLIDNYISQTVDLKFTSFLAFHENRRTLLKSKLVELLT